MSTEEILAILENIKDWAASRDGSAEADDLALRTIGEEAAKAIESIEEGGLS